MTTFAEFVQHHNNADVTGIVDAVNKMITNERRDNGLDMFNDSVSLKGLTHERATSSLVMIILSVSVKNKNICRSCYVEIL